MIEHFGAIRGYNRYRRLLCGARAIWGRLTAAHSEDKGTQTGQRDQVLDTGWNGDETDPIHAESLNLKRAVA